MSQKNTVEIILKALGGSQVQGEMKKIGGSFGKLKASAGKLKDSLFSLKGAFVAIGAGLVARSFIEIASSFESMTIKLDALTKGKGVETLEAINKWALGMPVNTRKAVDTFAMMQAMGLDPTIAKMQTLVDVSSIFGEDAMPRIARALGQIQTLGKLSAEELNQLAEAGINARKYLKNAFGMTVTELQSSGIEIDRIVSAIWKGLDEDFAGAAQANMTTWKGLTVTVISYFEEIQRRIMKGGIFDSLKNTLIEIVNVLSTNMEAIVSTVLGLIRDFQSLWGVLMSFPQGVIDFFRNLNSEMEQTKAQVDALADPTPFQQVWGYLSRLGQNILSVFTFIGRTVGNVFAAVVVDIVNILRGVWDTLYSLGEMIIAVFTFSPGKIKKAWAGWKDTAVSSMSNVANVGQTMIKSIGDAWNDMINEMMVTEGLITPGKPKEPKGKPALKEPKGKPAAAQVTESFGPSKEEFEAYQKRIDEAKRKRIEALMAIKQFSSEYHLFRMKQLDELAAKMKEAGLAEVDIERWKAEEIRKLNMETYQFRIDNATNMKDAIVAKFKLMALSTTNAFKKTADFIGDVYKQLENTISNVLYDSMTGKLKSLGDYWRAFYQSVMKMLSDIAAEIIKTWAIKQALKFAGGSFHSGGMVMHGGGVVPEFHGGGFVDRLPRYHSGGLANDERFAVLQTRERVLSRDQNVMFGQMYSKVMEDKSQGAAPVIVQMTVNAMDADSFNGKIMESKDAVAAAIMSATGNNHPIRRTR